MIPTLLKSRSTVADEVLTAGRNLAFCRRIDVVATRQHQLLDAGACASAYGIRTFRTPAMVTHYGAL